MYKVTKKFVKGPETQIGVFKTIPEARKFIQEKLAEDALQRIQAVYSLYEAFDLIETFDQSKLVTTENQKEESNAGGAGHGSGQRFSPTPFNMTPAPKGTPRSWVNDEDKDGKNK